MMWTCIECEHHYDSNNGDFDERMCHECMDQIYDEKAAVRKKHQVKSVMNKLDQIIRWIKGDNCAS